MHYILLSAGELYPMISMETSLDNESWVDGARFETEIPLLEFVVEGKESFAWCDYFRPSANVPLFSPRMKDLLAEAGVDCVDYYEARVKHVSSGETRKYWAANVIGQVRGMDRAQSKFKAFRGSETLVSSVEKLVLDETALKGVRLCRLAEYDLLMIIDGSVKEILEKGGLAGVLYCEPDQWDEFGRGL